MSDKESHVIMTVRVPIELKNSFVRAITIEQKPAEQVVLKLMHEYANRVLQEGQERNRLRSRDKNRGDYER